jgi:hypothetical protein
MAEDHVGDLKKARNELVKQRRSSVSALTEGDNPGHAEHQLDNLIKYQRAIEAIDRAVREEESAAEKVAGGNRRPLIRHED